MRALAGEPRRSAGCTAPRAGWARRRPALCMQSWLGPGQKGAISGGAGSRGCGPRRAAAVIGLPPMTGWNRPPNSLQRDRSVESISPGRSLQGHGSSRHLLTRQRPQSDWLSDRPWGAERRQARQARQDDYRDAGACATAVEGDPDRPREVCPATGAVPRRPARPCRAEPSHLIPVEDYGRLERAVAEALRETVGPDEAVVLQDRLLTQYQAPFKMPPAQALLLALRQTLPTVAESVLQRSRSLYAAADG